MKRILHRVSALVVMLLMLAIVACGVVEQNSEATTSVSFIDVGKGDCILIQTGGSDVLIDTGYGSTADDVIAYLRGRGVTRLACVIITHYDGDHVGGLSKIGEALPIDVVYLPGYEGSDNNYDTVVEAISKRKLTAKQVTGETELTLGEAWLRLYPSQVAYVPGILGEEGNDNDCSLIAALTCGGDSYLFMGDREKQGLAAYLDDALGSFDVLKMPHHGKKNGMTDDLIESVGPQIAVITDSVDKPASEKTLDLLDDAGAQTYCTSTDGTILIESDGAGHYTTQTDQ